MNQAFPEVIHHCAHTFRKHQKGTWITGTMQKAYLRLHHLGYAHSVECWHQEQLVGGLYGVVLGPVFFGESMFSRMPDASKVALVYLRQQNFQLIDCQLPSEHLFRMGAECIPRQQFSLLLERWCPPWGEIWQALQG
jgi:leucyl/phenylalanyl-tRNA--protein transferase